jgi:hypothetical protein
MRRSTALSLPLLYGILDQGDTQTHTHTHTHKHTHTHTIKYHSSQVVDKKAS